MEALHWVVVEVDASRSRDMPYPTLLIALYDTDRVYEVYASPLGTVSHGDGMAVVLTSEIDLFVGLVRELKVRTIRDPRSTAWVPRPGF